jgi:ABC-type uncharacterized transport system permease subunit
MPAFLGILGAVVVLAIIGLVRALSEFGHAGLVAWAKLFVAPTVFAIACVAYLPGNPKDRGVRSLFLSDRALRLLFIGVAILTACASIFSAIMGVGWMVAK